GLEAFRRLPAVIRLFGKKSLNGPGPQDTFTPEFTFPQLSATTAGAATGYRKVVLPTGLAATAQQRRPCFGSTQQMPGRMLHQLTATHITNPVFFKPTRLFFIHLNGNRFKRLLPFPAA